MSAENSRNVEESIITPEKIEQYWTNYDKYYKMEHYKISKSLSDSTLSKIVRKKMDRSK